MKQGCLAPDEAFLAIEDVLPLFNPTVNFSRNLELYDACGHLPTKNHPIVQEWVSSDRPENRYTNPRNVEPSSTYPRRPSGSIIASSIPQAPSSLSEPKLSDRIPSSLSKTTILNAPSSHSVIIHQQSSNSPSSAMAQCRELISEGSGNKSKESPERYGIWPIRVCRCIEGHGKSKFREVAEPDVALLVLVHVTLCYVTRIPHILNAVSVSVILIRGTLPFMPSPSKQASSASQRFPPSAIPKFRRQQFLSVSTRGIKQLTPESREHVSRWTSLCRIRLTDVRCLHRLASYRPPKSVVQVPSSRRAAVLVALFVGRTGDLYVLLSRYVSEARAPLDRKINDTLY